MSVKLYDGKVYASEDVSANNTVAAADSGVVLNIVKDAIATTLPAVGATNVGLTVIVRIGGEPAGGAAGSGDDGSVGHAISPNSADKIIGLGAAGVDDKDLLIAKADSKVGDYVKLVSDGSTGWFVQEAVGEWTREA